MKRGLKALGSGRLAWNGGAVEESSPMKRGLKARGGLPHPQLGHIVEESSPMKRGLKDFEWWFLAGSRTSLKRLPR